MRFGNERNEGKPHRNIEEYDWNGRNICTQVVRNQYGKQNWRARIQAI